MSRLRITQRIRTFQTNGVIPGTIDRAVGNTNVFATIDIHTIAVGIHLQAIDSEVVNTSGEDAKVPAVENCKITEYHIAAILQANRLITPGAPQRRAPEQTLSIDNTRPQDRNIPEVFTPDQTVMPMTVTVILVSIPGVRLGSSYRPPAEESAARITEPWSRYREILLPR